MIKITQNINRVITLKQPEINTYGSTDDGSRAILFKLEIVDENDKVVDTVQKLYTGEGFNEANAIWDTDKGLLVHALQNTPYQDIDLSTVPDNFEI